MKRGKARIFIGRLGFGQITVDFVRKNSIDLQNKAAMWPLDCFQQYMVLSD